MFKGKRADTGEWVTGHLLTGMGRKFIVGEVIDYDTEYIAPEWWWVVDPDTVQPVFDEQEKDTTDGKQQ